MPRFDRLEFDPQPEERPDGLPTGRASRSATSEQWLRKADDQRRRGLYENALRYYSRALELDKSLVAGWLGQVQMLIQLGEHPEAELWARKALELFRGQGDLMAGRAQALARIGDRKQAMELCDAALKQEGHSAYRWMVRGELMVAGRDEIDRHCFDKAVQADPDWLVPLEIALIYLEHDLPSKALLRARQAVEKAPQQLLLLVRPGALRAGARARPAGRAELPALPRAVAEARRGGPATRRAVRTRPWSLKRGLRRLLGR